MSERPESGALFRFIIGVLTLLTAVSGFAALFFVSIPAGNENALMFAMGAVFGWAGAVVASEYGATTTGRKVAESAVRQIERQTIANEGPSQVEVVNTADAPVPVDNKP